MAREEIVILNGARTPMTEWVGGRAGNGKPGGALKDVSAIDLGVAASKAALERSNVPPDLIDHVVMGMTVIASTRGVGLLPSYAQDFLNRSVTSRPLKGKAPTVDLVLGYKKSNKSPILKLLLSRLDELVARVSKRKKV